ncbi:putative Utp11 protein [Trypanosoma vivax]|uniref:Putative U3 snoRNA-associated protein UTP11 n=1 Tax=Trypanosoma vivax (strain Y486) TaxID=1055687 RepID=G0U4R7_TRYVY|nr:putative U3 snoRNA-associated protein UTP11 [Trypanosoma vivax]KAH8611522.1 putative Utp11 protein [Trypanosoma vivax]CCC52432.1 putative U3 snoRNA-associated protein UTP11 [Trypanosoma vivax Y486]
MTKGKGRNPGAGNLSKHVKRTVHKERSQPASRKHLGPLEKHKDHVVRSRRRKARMQRLLELKRAAAHRNPDEFSIGMTKAVLDIESGKMKRRPLSKEEGKKNIEKTLMSNARNVHYLKYKSHADLSRARDLIEEDALCAITAAPPQNKHIVFAESEEEFRHFDPLKHFDVTPDMLKQHPALRGSRAVLQDTVMPEEVLLSGHRLLSSSQRRKERREVQKKLLKSNTTDELARAAFVERLHAKKEMKMYRFSSLVQEVAAERRAEEGTDEDESGVTYDVDRFLQLKREKEERDTLLAARRIKEVQQRVQRSKSLNALANTIARQNDGLRRNLQQRRNSRFKSHVPRRAR